MEFLISLFVRFDEMQLLNYGISCFDFEESFLRNDGNNSILEMRKELDNVIQNGVANSILLKMRVTLIHASAQITEWNSRECLLAPYAFMLT